MTNRVVPLAATWGPEAGRLSRRLGAEVGGEQQVRMLFEAVARRSPDGRGTDPMAGSLWRACATGRNGVAKLASNHHLSERQVRRRCTGSLGFQPSVFRRVGRLQNLLRQAREAPGRLSDLAVAAGYADQAHAGRETKGMTGLSVRVLLDTQRRWLTETSDSFKTA